MAHCKKRRPCRDFVEVLLNGVGNFGGNEKGGGFLSNQARPEEVFSH